MQNASMKRVLLVIFLCFSSSFSGNESNMTRTITVIDVTPPVITLNGETNVSLFVGSDYVELGATAQDAVEGNVSVAMSGTVDTSTAGTYVITYTARDSVGNEANVTRTVTVVVPVLTSLSLSSSTTTLNVGETTELTVMGTYSDNTSKTVTQGIAYVITPSNSIEVNGTVLTAKKDGNVTLQAKVGTTLSNTIALNITWVVDGHVLPPEPDPAVNNATLLGVDVNDNGVRDDVERWIYETYKDKHPIHIDIAMQAARGYRLVLETPEKAKEIYPEVDKSAYCEGYFRVCVTDSIKNKFSLKRISTNPVFIKKIFNNKDRWDAYELFDTLLSGDSYTIPRCKKALQLCDFDISKYED